MSRGLLQKSIRQSLGFTLAYGLGLMAFHGLLAYIAPIVFSELSGRFLQMAIFKSIVKGLFGGDLGQTMAASAAASFAWIHPVPLLLLWTQAIVFWSRTPAAEIENGTMDILLSQPISRLRLFLSETLVWLLCGVVLILAAFLGNKIGGSFAAAESRLSTANLLKISINLFGLYLTVGGFACFCSSLCSRRAAAMGCAFIFVVLSYLIHTLVPFWSAVKTISFLSYMDYYLPLSIVRDSSWPIYNLTVLLGIAAFFWLAGMGIFLRRNLLTS